MPDQSLGPAATLLDDGATRAYTLDDDTPVLLSRFGATYTAVGGQCTHFDGPLAEGTVFDGVVMCPWHNACFSLRTGARRTAPAPDDLPRYAVLVDADGQVVVTTPALEAPPYAAEPAADARHALIVGDGAVAAFAADGLRREGFQGRITVLGLTGTPPVDRTNLSKDYLAEGMDSSWLPVRGAGWYAERRVTLQQGRVTGLDAQAHTVTLADDGGTLAYDMLLLATGGTPRTLPDLPGHDAPNVFLLRTVADTDAILAAVHEGARVIVIGSSFIGTEVASSLARGRGAHVSIVGIEAVPLAGPLGEALGRAIQQRHEADGITFHMGAKIRAILTDDAGRVTGVALEDGPTLPADLVVIGVGVRPATDYARDAGFSLADDGSFVVDAQIATSAPDVWAAGDIATTPTRDGGTQRIEHWRVAQQHGQVAARAMLGLPTDVRDVVPFFWSQQGKLGLHVVGHAADGWDEEIVRGDLATNAFTLLSLKDGVLVQAACSGAEAAHDQHAIEVMLARGVLPSAAQLRDASFDLVAFAGGARVAQDASTEA